MPGEDHAEASTASTGQVPVPLRCASYLVKVRGARNRKEAGQRARTMSLGRSAGALAIILVATLTPPTQVISLAIAIDIACASMLLSQPVLAACTTLVVHACAWIAERRRERITSMLQGLRRHSGYGSFWLRARHASLRGPRRTLVH